VLHSTEKSESMPNNRFPPGTLIAADVTSGRDPRRRASLLTRLSARLRADRFDNMLAVGVPAQEGSALAVHAQRLTTARERVAIADSLRRVLDAARHHDDAPVSLRLPVHRANVLAAEGIIDAVTVRLHSPRPVHPRGMARLRRTLADGTGPIYRSGRGDLAGRLGAALAEL